jgi:hypothetical protein
MANFLLKNFCSYTDCCVDRSRDIGLYQYHMIGEKTFIWFWVSIYHLIQGGIKLFLFIQNVEKTTTESKVENLGDGSDTGINYPWNSGIL